MTEEQALKEWNANAEQLQQQLPRIAELLKQNNQLRLERDLARNEIKIIQRNIKRMVTICK